MAVTSAEFMCAKTALRVSSFCTQDIKILRRAHKNVTLCTKNLPQSCHPFCPQCPLSAYLFQTCEIWGSLVSLVSLYVPCLNFQGQIPLLYHFSNLDNSFFPPRPFPLFMKVKCEKKKCEISLSFPPSYRTSLMVV